MQISTLSISSNRLLASALCAILVMFGNSVQGQAIEETLFTAGTVAKDGANQDWAYLSFQIDDPNLLRNRKLAIYSKGGESNSGQPFERKAVVSVQTNPQILKTLINRATHLGESKEALEAAIDMVFADLIPNPLLTLEAKLSGVIQGALLEDEQYVTLVMLSRNHPAVGLALGLAHVQPIGAGHTTFEVREYDAGSRRDLGVVGRVTVEAGTPLVLPAPGPAVRVPDVSVKGHLNALLRWGTPVELRRLALMHFGYNIYRVPKAYAEAAGYNSNTKTI